MIVWTLMLTDTGDYTPHTFTIDELQGCQASEIVDHIPGMLQGLIPVEAAVDEGKLKIIYSLKEAPDFVRARIFLICLEAFLRQMFERTLY